jgi:hypothetical protein
MPILTFFSRCCSLQNNKVKPIGVLRMSQLEFQNKLKYLKKTLKICAQLLEDFKSVMMDYNDLDLYNSTLPPKFRDLDDPKKSYKKIKSIPYKNLYDEKPVITLEINLKNFKIELQKGIKSPDYKIYDPKDNFLFKRVENENKSKLRSNIAASMQALKKIDEEVYAESKTLVTTFDRV